MEGLGLSKEAGLLTAGSEKGAAWALGSGRVIAEAPGGLREGGQGGARMGAFSRFGRIHF